MGNRQESTPYLLISVVLAGLLYLAGSLPLLTMSLDGVIYAGIARDLASGLGSFWTLPYFDAQVASFRDHPPLGLWFLSLWFEVSAIGYGWRDFTAPLWR
ncbi:MAG: hypothetical protein GKR90_06970 [Pseudomonadales bacterium]|nr:hypothetical protein [Pseudomonadales bacterium]